MLNKKNKGITLVALVITIIILLILAGISISALTNTGIFGKAKDAKQKSEEATMDQNTKLDEYESEIDKHLPKSNGGGHNKDNSWKDLNVTEKIDRLKNVSTKLAIFDKSISGTKSDYNSTAMDDNLNELEKATTVEKAECECGKVRKIFDKAVEMNLVKDYTDVETQTITADDGTTKKKEIIIAPIEEESVVLFDFNVYNFEQKMGIIPMPVSLDYQINPNGKEWLNGCKPDFSRRRY